VTSQARSGNGDGLDLDEQLGEASAWTTSMVVAGGSTGSDDAAASMKGPTWLASVR
jgi:hypothetical protein